MKHLSINATLYFLSMIIRFTGGAQDGFQGENLFSLEHHQRLPKAGIRQRNAALYTTAKSGSTAVLMDQKCTKKSVFREATAMQQLCVTSAFSSVSDWVTPPRPWMRK